MNERRRRLLRAAGLALAAGLAGCSGGSETETVGTATTPASTATTSAGETPTETPTATDTPTAGETPTETATESPADTSTETATESPTETPTDTPAETPTATDTPVEYPTATYDLGIRNVGASAWEVTRDESDAVAPLGEANPTMTFSVGARYRVENKGWSGHPFAFRAADDTPLLSQSADGTYEDDADVNWVDDGSRFEFTVTEDLAADLDHYVCTVHGSMRGSATAE